ncbi:MAG: hypothetical protein IKM61_01825 [Eubacteriaceae bacterium]|nr:hypothetical protein [Eubacteriaceae bacterium]
MIIEIESVYRDVFVHGREIKISELRKILNELILSVGEEDFTDAFCVRYDYEKLHCSSSVRADITIDLDTHLVTKAKY